MTDSQYEEVLMRVPSIVDRARLLSHDVLLRQKAASLGCNGGGAAEERARIIAFLLQAGGNGSTVRGAYAHKLAAMIEAGAHQERSAA